MRLDFQKTISSSQMTLPIVCVAVLAVWFLVPLATGEEASSYIAVDYGLWRYFPSMLTVGYWNKGLCVLLGALGVYLMAELNNANVLLRISSRLLSSLLAILLVMAADFRSVNPGHVVMIMSLLSFFSLFATYQLPSPMFTFTTYLLVSVASLVFPKMMFFVPLYWGLQGYLRSFSLRCLIASLLATVLPYWIYFSVSMATETMPAFVGHFLTLADLRWYDYSTITLRQALPFVFFLILFIAGWVDFCRNSFLDKTRTRIIYNVVITHGFFVLIFIALQPQCYSVLLPLMLVDTAIVYGHFFALNYTRFSHIFNLVILVLAIALWSYLALS